MTSAPTIDELMDRHEGVVGTHAGLRGCGGTVRLHEMLGVGGSILCVTLICQGCGESTLTPGFEVKNADWLEDARCRPREDVCER